MKHGIFMMALGTGAIILGARSGAFPVLHAASAKRATVSPAGEPLWRASIRSVSRSRFDAPDSSRDRSYGSAEWTRASLPTQSKVNVQFSYGGYERVLSWAILFGNCGTGSMPLMPVSNFPEIEVTGTGHATIEATLPMEMATSGTYHIDIYSDRQAAAESVVGCGNLRYSGG